jgi:hypothetical protein
MQKELIELQNNSNLKSSFEYNTNLEEFCVDIVDTQYPPRICGLGDVSVKSFNPSNVGLTHLNPPDGIY